MIGLFTGKIKKCPLNTPDYPVHRTRVNIHCKHGLNRRKLQFWVVAADKLHKPVNSPADLTAMNASNEHMHAMHTIQTWCLGMSESVKNSDLAAHMAHVSRRVRVYGIPGKESLDFRAWQARRKYEFEHEELLALNYQQTRLVSATQRRLRFNTSETTVGKSGRMLQLNKNIILEIETDGVWRVVEETVTDWQLKQLDMSKY